MLTENKIDDAILVSVNSFIKELQSRISIYDESTASNLDPVSFDLINSIIYKYTKRSASEVSVDDISLLKYDEIEQILNIVCTDKNELPNLLKMFNANVYTKKTTQDINKLSTVNLYFERIRSMIIHYMIEYQERNRSENNYNNEKRQKCEKYIELFSKTELDHYLTIQEYEELKKDIKNFGTLDNDIINLIKYINYLNVKLSKDSSIDVNLTSRVSQIGNRYLADNKELVKKATNIISNTNFDLELLPSIVPNYTKDEVEQEQLINTIKALIINSFYHKYEEMINNKEDISAIREIKNMIYSILEEIENTDSIILDTQKILEENKELLINHAENAMRYVEMSLSEIESETGTVNGKALPILIKMQESLEHLLNTKQDSKEYHIVRKLLEELIKEYNKIISRLDEKKLIKNN